MKDAGSVNITARIRIQQILIWGGLVAVIYLLRHLFAVIFLTFILSYIGNSAVNGLTKLVKFRRLSLVMIYMFSIIVILGVIFTLIPIILNEAKGLLARGVETGPSETTAGDTVALAIAGDTRTAAPKESLMEREIRDVLDSYGDVVIGAQAYNEFKNSSAFKDLVAKIEHTLTGIAAGLTDKVLVLINSIFFFILAVIFSFLILWDLPEVARRIAELEKGRTAEIYAAISPGLKAFSVMLGRAFEAQTGIAILNAVLTTIGFLILGVPSKTLLAVIVFFCSYIPVLGVFLSTIPAAMFALKVGGMSKVVGVIVMVLIVHAIEAYGLNPLIYGHHMRLHPVLVLVVLMIGEHLVGVWGLILAVPMTAFVMKYMIQGEEVLE